MLQSDPVVGPAINLNALLLSCLVQPRELALVCRLCGDSKVSREASVT
jgi:hypothetical protein